MQTGCGRHYRCVYIIIICLNYLKCFKMSSTCPGLCSTRFVKQVQCGKATLIYLNYWVNVIYLLCILFKISKYFRRIDSNFQSKNLIEIKDTYVHTYYVFEGWRDFNTSKRNITFAIRLSISFLHRIFLLTKADMAYSIMSIRRVILSGNARVWERRNTGSLSQGHVHHTFVPQLYGKGK